MGSSKGFMYTPFDFKNSFVICSPLGSVASSILQASNMIFICRCRPADRLIGPHGHIFEKFVSVAKHR